MATYPSATPLRNPFLFETAEIRTAVDDTGEVWFCAKDVFEALGIVWKGTKGSLINTPEKWSMVCYLQTSQGQKETIFLSEPAVYQTIFSSRKPEAIRFAEWVCEEVLPAIRKQGFFGTLTGTQRLAMSKQLVTVAEKLSHTKDATVRELLTRELRELCNLLGWPLPETLAGKQLALEV